MKRQGRPVDAVDAEIVDIRRIWGPDARIDIIDDEDGHYILTVTVHRDAAQTFNANWCRVDTRVVPTT